MLTTSFAILAQDDYGDDLQRVLTIVFVIALYFLSGLGSWLRKKTGMKSDEEELEEVLGEEIVEAPQERVEEKAPRRPLIPQARPLRRGPPAPPARPKPVSQQTLSAPPATQAVRVDRAGPAPSEQWAPLITSEELPTRIGVQSVDLDDIHRAIDRRIDLHAEVERHDLEEGPKVTMRGVTLGPLRVDDLRRAIVLKEVLGPPVSLRKPGEELWAPL